MKNLIIRWIASALALAAVSRVVPGIRVTDSVTLLIAVVLLGFANSVIRPIIMLFAWPVNCLTFGLFGFILNVGLFYAVGNTLKGFHVDNYFAALIGSVSMGILCGLFNFALADVGERIVKRKE